MSAVGLSSKGEKQKQKYSALNINNIFKGKSLENPKTSVAPKHGLQTLGKVGAGRRMPPPANLPSLKSQNNNNPNVNLVPSGGQGWGSGKEEESGSTHPSQTSSSGQTSLETTCQLSSNVNPSAAPQQLSANVSMHTTCAVPSNANAICVASSASASSKTWSSVTSFGGGEAGGRENNFLGQELPFFPQEFPKLIGGSVPTDATIKANIESSYGSGPSLRPQTEGSWGRGTLHGTPFVAQHANRQNLTHGNGVNGQLTDSPPLPSTDANVPQMSRQVYPNQVNAIPHPRPTMTPPMMAAPGNGGAAPQMLLPQAMGSFPQYRMFAQYQIPYPRAAYPAAFQPGSAFHQQQPQPQAMIAPARQPYDTRMRQRVDDMRPAVPAPPIISDKDLKSFDEILENEEQAGWAAHNQEIDYNAKLVFSDDEDSAPLKEGCDDQTDYYERKQKHDWDAREYDKDEQNKYRPPHPPSLPKPLPPIGFEYQSQQTVYSQPTPQIPANFSRHSSRSEMVADDDEMWRQRSRQQSDEMAAAVVRARQRREEDEKNFERSRQLAHEKLKALEEKFVDRDGVDIDVRSRHSSESRDDKYSVREQKDARNNYASKQYSKAIAPRFQKQAELQRQQQINQNVQSPPYDQRLMDPLRRVTESDKRVINAVSNANQLSNKPPLISDSPRSNSQISSDSERERQTPDSVHSKDKRHKQSPIENSNWRTIARHPSNDNKENSDIRSYDMSNDSEKSEHSSQSDNVKRYHEKPLHLTQTENSTQQIKIENFNKLSEDSRDKQKSRENIEKRISIERRESSQSSQSDIRSTSSKEEKFRRYEVLDWASEIDNLPIGYGRRDRHRHVPITQKHFESINEPQKKNLTTLKKNNSSSQHQNSGDIKEFRDNAFNKVSDIKDNSQNKSTHQTTTTTATSGYSKSGGDVSAVKAQTINKESGHSENDDKRERESGIARNKDKDRSKRDPNNGERTRRPNSNRYRSSYGRYASSQTSSYRGGRKEFRRSRASNDKNSDSKYTSNSGTNTRKLQRKSNSDESNFSEEIKRDPQKESGRPSAKAVVSTTNVTDSKDKEIKENKEKEKANYEPIFSFSVTPSSLQNQRSDSSRSNRGRGAAFIKTGMPRVCPSNYGPPPSRAAFGGNGNIKSQLNDNTKGSDKSDFKTGAANTMATNFADALSKQTSSSSKDETITKSNATTSAVHDDNQRQNNRKSSISSNKRKNNKIGNNRGAINSNYSTNRSETLPPRFQNQKKHSTSHRGRGRGSERTARIGSSHVLESDNANSEVANCIQHLRRTQTSFINASNDNNKFIFFNMNNQLL